MRNKTRPPTPEEYLGEAVAELRRLTDALINQANQKQDAPVVNVDVPEAQVVIQEKEESNDNLIAEIKRLGATIAAVAGRKQEAPVVNVENKMPDITFPQIRIPDIHIPEIRIPEIRMPQINMPEMKMPDYTPPAITVQSAPPRTWIFKHKYDVYNKLVETSAIPQ